MPVFEYLGYDSDGNEVKGVKEATSESQLLSQFAGTDIFIEKIRQLSRNQNRRSLNLFNKKSLKQDVYLYLATLVSAGFPLVEALEMTAKSVDKKTSVALFAIAEKVSSGSSLSLAVFGHEFIFPANYTGLLKIALNTGRLPEVLMEMAEYEENSSKLKDSLTNALIYPLSVLTLGMGVLGFLLTFIVPKLKSAYVDANVELPVTTIFLMRVSDFLTNYGWIVFIFVLFLIFLFKRSIKNGGFIKQKLDKAFIGISFVNSYLFGRFCRLLAFQISEGVPMVEALNNSMNITENDVFVNSVKRVSSRVETGVKFSDSLSKEPLIPDLMVAAARTGEGSGKTSDMFFRLADLYDKNAEKVSKRFLLVAEPLFIAITGLLIGFVVISTMEPLFNMNTLIR